MEMQLLVAGTTYRADWFVRFCILAPGRVSCQRHPVHIGVLQLNTIILLNNHVHISSIQILEVHMLR